jgi:hypothetical protein
MKSSRRWSALVAAGTAIASIAVVTASMSVGASGKNLLPSLLPPSGEQTQVLNLAKGLQQAETSLSGQDLQLQSLTQQVDGDQSTPVSTAQLTGLVQQFDGIEAVLNGDQTQSQTFSTQLTPVLKLLKNPSLLGGTLTQELLGDLTSLTTGAAPNATPAQELSQAVSTFAANVSQALASLAQLDSLLSDLTGVLPGLAPSGTGAQPSPTGGSVPQTTVPGTSEPFGGSLSTGGTSNGSATATCTPPGHAASDPHVSDPSAPHGLYVLSGSSPLSKAKYGKQIQKYLVNNPDVCGGAVFVFWNKVDNGPGAKQRYNWSYVNQLIAPWAKAHKTVALLLGGATGYASDGEPGGVPTWLLPQLNEITCGRTEAPVYWQKPYSSNWMAFVAAFIDHYEKNPNVAYVHVGVGSGESTLVLGVKDDRSCLDKWNAVGYQSQWPSYVSQVISFVGKMHAPIQLNVSINSFANYPSSTQIAAEDAAWGIGFGFNGLQASDATAAAANNADPQCNADWCGLYNQYAGKVPLYIQTLQASDPGPGTSSTSESTGPLPPLLSTALEMHTQIFELYAEDWLMAFDPTFPGYSEYHTKTAQALDSAASIVGTSGGGSPSGDSVLTP